DYRVAEAMKLKDFPCEPDKLVSQPLHFLKALDDAAGTAAGEATRYALLHLELRGEKGQLVGTDGKQLLIQGGFSFPWKGDLLVPSLALFGCRELPQDVTVLVGHTESHVTLRVGPWTFHLTINKDGRFPCVEA